MAFLRSRGEETFPSCGEGVIPARLAKLIEAFSMAYKDQQTEGSKKTNDDLP
jgi:hypothetical protein